jgi:hypothetical protein
MSAPQTRPADKYSPLYFLASVGAGGLSVTFFMYLMFWVPHPNATVPVFEDIMAAWATGGLPLRAAIAIAMTGIAVFAFLNLKLLVWNLGQMAQFRKTPAYEKLRSSNAETQILAQPLALAMSVNAMFILGLVFVPNLWSVVEYLFPAAMVAFVLIGGLALVEIGHFLRRVLTQGGIFDVTANNSFAQLLPAFALAMAAVGLAAPAALSTNATVVAAGLAFSTLFGTMAVIYAAVALVMAFNSMLHYGTAKESGPTLMIIVPLMTILGIMWMRQSHGLHTTFDVHAAAAENFMLMTKLLAVQVTFLMLGLLVLRKQGYASAFLTGPNNSPGSYALVCPGVALSVMLQFWINKGLVELGVIAKYGVAYWGFTAVAIAFQVAMIGLVFWLNRRHFGRVQVAPVAVPAE